MTSSSGDWRKRLENYTANGRAVPWYDWNEWLTVKRQIFSQNVNEMRQAQSRLTIWKNRNSRLPHAVDCTLSILQCLSKPLNEMAIGLLIVRFVNGFLETSQKASNSNSNSNKKNNRYKQSISVVMDTLSIPKAIVDVRHEVTHGQMPSASHLQHTIKLCFQWLQMNYWDKQEQQLIHDSGLVLNSIREWRILLQNDPDVTPQAKWNEIERKMNDLKKTVGQLMLNDIYSRSFHLQHFILHDLLQEDLIVKGDNGKLVERANQSIPLFSELHEECEMIMVYIIRTLMLIVLEQNLTIPGSTGATNLDQKKKLATMWLAIVLNDDYLTQIIESDDVRTRDELNALMQHLFELTTSCGGSFGTTIKRIISSSTMYKGNQANQTVSTSVVASEWQLCGGGDNNHCLSEQMSGTCPDTLNMAHILRIPESVVRKRMRSFSADSQPASSKKRKV